jgi:hypothetical protein
MWREVIELIRKRLLICSIWRISVNCPKCGKLRKPSDKFCGKCGSKFDSFIDKPKIISHKDLDNKQNVEHDTSEKIEKNKITDDKNKLDNSKNLASNQEQTLKSEPNPEETLLHKPKHDPASKSLPDFSITWGEAYLIVSNKMDFGLKIFEKLMAEQSKHGLSISRMHPNQLSKFIEAQDFDKLWLSKSTEEYSIQPGNITKIAHLINKHYKADDKSIVFLDGLEYLINNNDFPKVLKFIESIHEKNVLNEGILLVPVNPSTLDENNLLKLKNELINMVNDPIT